MLGRPLTALALVFTVLGALTVTAFAISMPSVSAPQAHDLPTIVSEVPVGTDPATATVGATPSTSKTSTVDPAGTGSVSKSGTGGTASSPTGSGSSQASTDPDADGDNDAKTPDESSEHEVVKVRLHESDDKKPEAAKSSSPSKATAIATFSGGHATENRYSH